MKDAPLMNRQGVSVSVHKAETSFIIPHYDSCISRTYLSMASATPSSSFVAVV